MGKKYMTWKTKGMNRDLSVSAFNPEFSFENRNLRLSTSEGNTTLSWVNERSTEIIQTSTIEGIPVGTAVVDHKLVLFTTRNTEDVYTGSATPDYIYLLEYSSAGKLTMTAEVLYSGNLNFSTKAPLETLVSVESNAIQKVYWTDGRNQPRLINIMDSDKLADYRASQVTGIATFFDFVPAVALNEVAEVTKNSSGGSFAPGVIQYCFSYINKYSQQSNIVWTSPLYYLSHSDRGASPEDMVNDSFNINILDIDPHFDYVRLYSVQRTSIDGTVKAKQLIDLPVGDLTVAGKTSDVMNTGYGSTSPYANTSLGISTHSLKPVNVKVLNALDCGYSSLEDIKEHCSPIINEGENSISVTINLPQDISLDRYYAACIQGNEELLEYVSFTWPEEIDDWYNERGNIDPDRVLYDLTAQATENHNAVSYTDNGIGGTSIDPMELLYIGGKEITALTMIDKDGTLFMGNIQQKNEDVQVLQDYFDSKREAGDITITFAKEKALQFDIDNNVYCYNSLLDRSRREITTFKGGETYRFGFQLQKNTGEWSEPIFLKDEENKCYPDSSNFGKNVNLALAKATISLNTITGFDFSLYKRIRPVIVYPSITDRHVLCQGVLNPTVFNALDRIEGRPFAQASWFFRPYTIASEGEPGSQSSSIDITVIPNDEPDHFYDEEPLITYLGGAAMEVYIMIATVSNGINYILREGEIRALEKGRQTIVDFDGAICLSGSKYAFLRKGDPWPEPSNDFSYSGITGLAFTTREFAIYNGLFYKLADSYLLTYSNPTADITYNIYTFKFSIVETVNSTTVTNYYNVAFTSENVSTKLGIEGSVLRFKHYDTIDGTGSRRGIEIQGSTRLYDSPIQGSSATLLDSNSNAQFFIDHSIVTLNSPDIDFDTLVQRYSMEDLHLRIVGAIPITANASSHKIIHSATMELGWDGDSGDGKFGKGELNLNVKNINVTAFAAKRLVAEYLWNDACLYKSSNTVKSYDGPTDYLVYPWQRSGSLNNDNRIETEASSWLKQKKEATLLYSSWSSYLTYNSTTDNRLMYGDISTQLHLQENEFLENLRLPAQAANCSAINYYPNIDTVLYNTDGYYVFPNIDPNFKSYSPVSMKYKSTSHAVIALNGIAAETASTDSDYPTVIPILPYYTQDNISIGEYGAETAGKYGDTFWGDKKVKFNQKQITQALFPSTNYDFLWIGELVKDVTNPFGGESKEAVLANKWQVAGDAVALTYTEGALNNPEIKWTEGDTFYQRYDCLKTYPFTNEDINQIVEILSFMCETRINLDGRYDRNRGQLDNTTMSPVNFNLLNDIYSQQDNFFTYRKKNDDAVKNQKYPNLITYSKTKEEGADVDLWTNVTLASSLSLDGDKGEITKLTKLNDQLIAFQDSGISQLLYNENVQISTTQGVPIEIANSGKVQGKRYLSNTVGCSNKWSVATTPAGIYFMDSIHKGIYLFNGQIVNLSEAKGFNAWSKQNIPAYDIKWSPDDFDAFVTYYDKENQDVLSINKETALAFSETVQLFTSFYDYGNTPYFCNLDDTGVWIRTDVNNKVSTLWRHRDGNTYCKFFGVSKPYNMTLIGNAEPMVDKTFTNLEFRASVDGEGQYNGNTGKFTSTLPFNTLEVWDEYQHGYTTLENKTGLYAALHGSDSSALQRKFRMWRCDIPRNNAKLDSERGISEDLWYSTDRDLGISRMIKKPMDRMRNPWLYLKLQKDAETNGLSKVEIHDLVMTYFD